MRRALFLAADETDLKDQISADQISIRFICG